MNQRWHTQHGEIVEVVDGVIGDAGLDRTVRGAAEREPRRDCPITSMASRSKFASGCSAACDSMNLDQNLVVGTQRHAALSQDQPLACTS